MWCPECEHKLKSAAVGVFWCPRCGTILYSLTTDAEHLVPDVTSQQYNLIEMCKTLRDVAALAFQTVAENGLTDLWIHRLHCHNISVGFGKAADDAIAKAEGKP